MRWRPSKSAALAIVLLGFSAHATARKFDLVNDAATNAEGEIELEGWMDLGRPAPGRTNVMFWLGARIGLLDSLELASFLVFEKRGDPASVLPLDVDEGNGLMEWVTELRWRPLDPLKLPVDIFVQGQLIDWFEQFHPVQARVTLGVSKQAWRFLFAANFSYWFSATVPGPPKLPAAQAPGSLSPLGLLEVKYVTWRWLEPSAAASVLLIESDGSLPNVNLGVEFWGFVPLTTLVHSHLLMNGGLVVGPTLSASRGRLWLTAHMGFPIQTLTPTPAPGGPLPYVSKVDFAPPTVGRVMLGINL